MKKLLLLILSICLLTGCETKKKTSPEEYYFTYNGSDIKLNTLFSNTYSIIGNYNFDRLEDSYYYEYKSNVYEYDDFEIETYYDNDIEKIAAITLTSENIQTTESLRIYDSKEKMINIYGKNYQLQGNTYIYKLANTNLSFTIENDIIISIRYYIE